METKNLKTFFEFYISSGRKNAQYTLRQHRWTEGHIPGNGTDVDFYIRNLGTNEEKALAKAREVVEHYRGLWTENPSVVILDSLDTEFSLNPYGEETWDTYAKYVVTTLGLFPFGKHKGTPIADAPESYIMYWATQEVEDTARKRAAYALSQACKAIADERGYFKQLAIEEEAYAEHERRFPPVVSDYVGVIGKRQNFKIVVDFVTSFESVYGTAFITKGKDSDGNIIVYFGSADLGRVGDAVEFSASVKKHDEYQGDKQTTIKRPTKIKIKEVA